MPFIALTELRTAVVLRQVIALAFVPLALACTSKLNRISGLLHPITVGSDAVWLCMTLSPSEHQHLLVGIGHGHRIYYSGLHG